MKKLLLIIISIMIFIGGCAVTDDAYNKYPRKIITNDSIVKASKADEIFDGFIIGIEKRKRKDVIDISPEICLKNKTTGNSFQDLVNGELKIDALSQQF